MRRAGRPGRGAVLPDRRPLDVGRLVQSFGDMTQCYKVLFLRSLVEALVEDGGGTFVAYEELAVRMAEAAWWPLRRYRLRTGRDDILGRAVRALPASLASGVRLRSVITRALPGQRGKGGYLFYVPQRLLRPWFAAEGVGLAPDVDAEIRARSLRLRDELRLPYGQDERRGGVDVHPEWRSYFVDNAAVLTGWLELLWIDWLQQRNPLVPVTRAKLAPPPHRRALLDQKAVFEATFAAMRAAGRTPTCIFTGAPLLFPASPIDHFLPWSFLAHDGLWNLVPVVDGRFNSRKSDQIPDPALVQPLAAFHRDVVSSIDAGTAKGCAALEDYGLGLRLETSRLGDPGKLEKAYHDVLPPLMATARSMGFRPFAAGKPAGLRPRSTSRGPII